MQFLLHTVPLTVEHWLMIAVLAAPLIVVPEIVKLLVACYDGTR